MIKSALPILISIDTKVKKASPDPKAQEFPRYNVNLEPATEKPRVVSVDGKTAHDHFISKKARDQTLAEMERIQAEKKPLEKAAEKQQKGLGEIVKGTFHNIRNLANNAFDNTVGYGISKYQNMKGVRELKRDQGKPIAYIVNGLVQNEGAGWRRAGTLSKRGFVPLHIKTHHREKMHEAYEKTAEQIKRYHERAKIEEPAKRADAMVGHSSGGNDAIYAAQQKRTRDELGVKYVQAIAPTPYGYKPSGTGAKVMAKIMDASGEDTTTKEGREYAVQMDKGKPYISVHVVAGEKDELVKLKDAVYKHADRMHFVRGKDSTHFGTSGSNPEMNETLADLLEGQRSDVAHQLNPGHRGDRVYKLADYKMQKYKMQKAA